jgi:hypothetical protein
MTKKLLLAMAVALLPVLPAMADTIPCSVFQKNPDGSWSAKQQITITGPNGQVTISPGVSYRPGVAFMGIDLAAQLEQQCH